MANDHLVTWPTYTNIIRIFVKRWPPGRILGDDGTKKKRVYLFNKDSHRRTRTWMIFIEISISGGGEKKERDDYSIRNETVYIRAKGIKNVHCSSTKLDD